MWHITDFQRALDLLCVDRSPRSCTRALSDQELRMLAFAQLLRGTQYQAYRPGFVSGVRRRILRDRFLGREVQVDTPNS